MQTAHPSYSNYRCVACNVYFNNFDEQKQHYFTYHSRSVEQAPFNSNLYSSYRQLSSNTKKGQSIKCEACNICCSSQITFDFHMKGKKHAKIVSKLGTSKTETSPTNGIIENETKAEETITITPVIQQSQILYKPNLMCDLCQITCLQVEQLQKHLDGAKHKKKLKLHNYNELKAKKDPSIYCDTCDMFLTVESMTKHRESGKHKRKSTDKTTDEPAEKKLKPYEIATSIEYCGFCHINLKNVNEAVAHYQTPKHAVNMLNRSKNFELWCDLCQISFANQHFYDTHVKGFRHYVRANRGNNCPEGQMGDRLIKMREKMRGLKVQNRFKKFSYSEKYRFVPNEPMPANPDDLIAIEIATEQPTGNDESTSSDADKLVIATEDTGNAADPQQHEDMVSCTPSTVVMEIVELHQSVLVGDDENRPVVAPVADENQMPCGGQSDDIPPPPPPPPSSPLATHTTQ